MKPESSNSSVLMDYYDENMPSLISDNDLDVFGIYSAQKSQDALPGEAKLSPMEWLFDQTVNDDLIHLLQNVPLLIKHCIRLSPNDLEQARTSRPMLFIVSVMNNLEFRRISDHNIFRCLASSRLTVELDSDEKSPLKDSSKYWMKGLIEHRQHIEDLYPDVVFNWIERILKPLNSSTLGSYLKWFVPSSWQQQDTALTEEEALLFHVCRYFSVAFCLKTLMIAAAFPDRLNQRWAIAFSFRLHDAYSDGCLRYIFAVHQPSSVDEAPGNLWKEKFSVSSKDGDDYEEKKRLIFDRNLGLEFFIYIYRSSWMTIERLQRMLDLIGKGIYREVLPILLVKICRQNKPSTIAEASRRFNGWMDAERNKVSIFERDVRLLMDLFVDNNIATKPLLRLMMESAYGQRVLEYMNKDLHHFVIHQNCWMFAVLRRHANGSSMCLDVSTSTTNSCLRERNKTVI